MSYLVRIGGVLLLMYVTVPKLFGQIQERSEIRGRIIDSTNNVPLSNAIVRIKNKSIGTSSNNEGQFSIGLRQTEETDSLVISMIGYLSQTIAVKDLNLRETNTFPMIESVVLLEEVEVTLPDVNQIVKEVSKRLKTTFPSESIEFEGFYRKAYREFGHFVKQYEVAITGLDDQFHKRNGFAVSRLKEKESRDFRKNIWRQSEGNVPWHYLWHVRRQHLHFFNSSSFNTYYYSLEDIIDDNGERIYKIIIKLGETSERVATSWAFVRESDFAILEIGGETTMLNPEKFQLSDSLWMDYTGGNVLVKYMDHGGKMYPAYSRSSYNHRIYNQKSELQGTADMNEELFIHEVNTDSQYKNKKIFVEDQQKKINELPTDSVFWESFSVPLETELSRNIKRDLARFENATQIDVIEDRETSEPLTIESLEKDFDLFRHALEEAHPSLYRYSSKEEMNNLLDSARLKLNRPMESNEFFRQLTPIIARISCGHTRSFMPENYSDDGDREDLFLPIQTKYISGKLYIWKVYDPEKNDLVGMEIKAINGVEIDEIISSIYPHLTADGYITTSKDRQLEGNFSIYFEHLVKLAAQFEVNLESQNGYPMNDTLTAISEATYSSWKGHTTIENNFRILSRQTGLLKIGTFMDTEAIGFESWLEEAFLEIKDKKVNHLIIDLRDNEGGNDLNAINLLGYLVNEPFQFHRSLHSTTNRFTFLSETDEGESLNSLMAEIVQKDPSGNYQLRKSHPTLGWKSPHSDVYQGKIYFLINGKTFSTSADFAAIARELNLGVFIGEETGGAAEGNTSNGEINFTLPNSKIRVAIPLFQIQNAVSENVPKGMGVRPDYEVTYTIDDYLRNKDLEIELAMKLTNE